MFIERQNVGIYFEDKGILRNMNIVYLKIQYIVII